MTRETKVGLVVSCSFLCLLGTVLYFKLKEPAPVASEYASADGAPLEAPEDPAPVAETPSAVPSGPPLGSEPTAPPASAPTRLPNEIIQTTAIDPQATPNPAEPKNAPASPTGADPKENDKNLAPPPPP